MRSTTSGVTIEPTYCEAVITNSPGSRPRATVSFPLAISARSRAADAESSTVRDSYSANGSSISRAMLLGHFVGSHRRASVALDGFVRDWPLARAFLTEPHKHAIKCELLNLVGF